MRVCKTLHGDEVSLTLPRNEGWSAAKRQAARGSCRHAANSKERRLNHPRPNVCRLKKAALRRKMEWNKNHCCKERRRRGKCSKMKRWQVATHTRHRRDITLSSASKVCEHFFLLPVLWSIKFPCMPFKACWRENDFHRHSSGWGEKEAYQQFTYMAAVRGASLPACNVIFIAWQTLVNEFDEATCVRRLLIRHLRLQENIKNKCTAIQILQTTIDCLRIFLVIFEKHTNCISVKTRSNHSR